MTSSPLVLVALSLSVATILQHGVLAFPQTPTATQGKEEHSGVFQVIGEMGR